MTSETLIDLATKKESYQFAREWNKRYKELGTVHVKLNPHDFGSYPTIEIEVGLFGNLPSGVEEKAIELADELGLDY